VVCAAALAVLDVIEQEGLVERAERMGTYLVEALQKATAGDHGVTEVRGTGLLCAVQLDGDRSVEVVAAARDRGLIVNNVTPSAIRLAPPLIVTEDEIDRAVGLLVDALTAVRERTGG
jgi:acetylornithine aminotransferase